jgi:hypothetical protein
MLPSLTGMQTFLPYLLAMWLTPFIIIAVKMARRPKSDQLEEFPYAKNRELFSPAERSLLRLLEQAAGEKFRILAKVRAGDIVNVKLMSEQSAWFRAVDQISSRSFDFVLCDKEYLSLVCAIKLKDAAHASQPEHERDTFLEGVCEAISLPLVNIIAPSDLSVSQLREKIQVALNQGSEAEVETSEQPFLVGLDNHPAVGERPWTLDEARLLQENAGRYHIRRTL